MNDVSERIDINEDSVSTSDHYFLTDPEEFIHHCFPDKPEWQLLRTPLTKDEFLDMPFLMPSFFDYKLKLLTKPKCVLNSKDGVCTVSIKSPLIEDMVMTYELYYDVKESGSSLPSGVPMDRCVAIMQQKGRIAFGVRFLHSGIYRFDIHGALIGTALTLLCSFKLYCFHRFPHNIMYFTILQYFLLAKKNPTKTLRVLNSLTPLITTITCVQTL